MNNSKGILDKLSEWIKTEYKLLGELYAQSNDQEEKKRLHAERGVLKKVLEKLDEFEHSHTP